MSEELKRCPFCGAEAEEIVYIIECVVQCSSMECGIGITRKELNKAIEAWNKRVFEPTSPFTSDNY